jgi:hypothetical protein
MFGFMIGIASLFGLIWVLRGGGGGCGRGFSGRGWGRRRGWGRGFGRWGMLDGLFERLDVSSAQEKDIRAAIGELFDAGRDFRREVFDSRSDVARAFKADAFDATLMGEVFARHDDSLDKLRKAAVGSLAKIHAVLDDKQRERLASFFESGARGSWGGGPYRDWA